MANSWKDLDITKAELDNIEQALKNKEFRKLLVEYCEELTDPASKKKYQEDITQLEKERGVDVTFIDPKPGYVIKTSIDGNKLAFINVCSNEHVQKPTSQQITKDGTIGKNWSVPHLLSPPREDLNKKGKRCTVFDVIYHSEALTLALKNKSFYEFLNNMSCEAVEINHSVKLDKTNLIFPKLQYKGMARPLVIRKKIGETHKLNLEDPVDKIYSDIYNKLDENTSKKGKDVNMDTNMSISKYTTPKYIIKHRTNIDIQDFTYDVSAHENDAIPNELLVEINLPLLKSSSDLQLDVTEKTLTLISEKPSKYKLFLTLPYEVFEQNGSAKFEQDSRKLIVTLPVKRRSSNLDFSNDSGVDSDNSPVVSNFSLEDNLPLIEELNLEDSEKVKIISDSSCEYRTKNVFLDPELHYSLPEYSCHLFNDILIFTLRVKNVENTSLKKIFTNENLSVHIKFSSLSPAFVPINYAFYIHFDSHIIDVDNFSTEIWDNNVVVQIPYLSNDIPITNYFVGISKETTEEKIINEPSNIFNKRINNKIIKNINESDDDNLKIEVSANLNEVEIDITIDNEVQQQRSSDEEINNKNNPKTLSHSYSESSCDEFSVSPTKSILKSRSRTPLSRSVSESSVDDYMWSSFENYASVSDSLIPEELEVSSSMKKTVRFNDVVSKQLFRTNSSILGQKKKNQRKSRNKKRAHERRLSESENSESEDKKDKLKKEPENVQTQNGTDQHETKNDFKNDLIFDIDM